MKIKTDGLVIKEQDIGEQDRLLTILTRENGIIRVFAKNVRNIKSPKGSSTRLLCYSSFVIYKGRDTYSLNDVELIDMFIPLRKDIIKMSLAQYFCELAMYFVGENMHSEMYLRLILNALYIAGNTNKPLGLIKSATELRMLCLAGYMPNLIYCNECNCYEDEQMCFLPKRGFLVCLSCINENEEYSNERIINLGMGATTGMRHCIYSKFEKLFSFDLSKNSLELLEMASEEYMVNICEKVLKTLDFYKVISS